MNKLGFVLFIAPMLLLFAGCVCNRFKVVDAETDSPIANAKLSVSKNWMFIPLPVRNYTAYTNENGEFSAYSMFGANVVIRAAGYAPQYGLDAAHDPKYLEKLGLKKSDLYRTKTVVLPNGGNTTVTEKNPQMLGEIDRLEHLYPLYKEEASDKK